MRRSVLFGGLSVWMLFLSTVVVAQFGENVQLFPQVGIGGGAATDFSIHNPTDETITVRIEIRGSDGSRLEEDRTVELGPAATVSISYEGGEELTVGWARLSSEGKFNATEFFRLVVGGEELPRVGVLPARPSSETKIFGFVKNQQTNTGIAVANPSETEESDVTVRLIPQDGTPTQTAELNLLPLEHFPVFLNEEPLFPGLTDFEGVVELDATNPVIILTFRSDNNLLASAAILTPLLDGQLGPGSVTSELLAEGAVGNTKLADNAVTESKIAPGQVVKSLNGLTDSVVLEGGANIDIATLGNTLRISGAGGAGFGDITEVRAGNGLQGGGVTGSVTVELDEDLAAYLDDLQSGLRVEPEGESTPNHIAGPTNSRAAGIVAASIGGGGNLDFPNIVNGNYGTVGGGRGNTAGLFGTSGGGEGNANSGTWATVGGGANNVVSGELATIAGGDRNGASGSRSVVGGGGMNNANGIQSSIGGGANNTASGTNSTVAGGGPNNVASGSTSTIGGGSGNSAIGPSATIGGGTGNSATGAAATIPGGRDNVADGDNSFAAGEGARALHDGSFVWADGSVGPSFDSTAINQFLIRAAGGIGIGRNNPAHPIHLASGAHVTAGGAWTNASDANFKENLEAVDVGQVLKAVAALPISTWNYKSEEPSVRHMGATAQDFKAAFGLGQDEGHISTVDADGVALAAIQGLYQLLQAQQREIEMLKLQLEASATDQD